MSCGFFNFVEVYLKSNQMKKLLLFSILFLPIMLMAQNDSINKSFILKTNPIQDAFYQNPNLTIEKAFQQKYAISLLMALRYSDWISENTNIGKLPIKYDAKGWTIGVGFKYYYSKNKNRKSKPYIGGVLRYQDIAIPYVEIGYETGPEYGRTVELKRNSGEMGALWGYQALLSRFVMDFYAGTGLQYRKSEEELLSGSSKYLNLQYTEFIPRLYLGFAIGVKLF